MGDATAFVDHLGNGWWIYSRKPDLPWTSRVLRICRMTSDMLNLSGGVVSTISQPLEAPAVFYAPAVRRYYLWASHTSGCEYLRIRTQQHAPYRSLLTILCANLASRRGSKRGCRLLLTSHRRSGRRVARRGESHKPSDVV